MEKHDRKGSRNYLRVLISDFAMGAADVVPGVSGGTVAFILGIYEDLLDAIHSVNLDFFRSRLGLRWREAFQQVDWRFMLALGTGILLAIFTIAEALVWGLEHHPELIWSFFFGLVLASVLVIARRIRRWTFSAIVLVVAGAIFAYTLVGLTPVETPTAAWFLFFSGALAISAMILPGISGAFILVLLGKYQYLLESLVSGNWLPLVIVAAGAAAGLISFARLLRWLFRYHHDLTVAALIGFISGALRKVWPWKEPVSPVDGSEADLLLGINRLPPGFTTEVALALSLMAIGFIVVLALEFLSRDSKLTNPD